MEEHVGFCCRHLERPDVVVSIVEVQVVGVRDDQELRWDSDYLRHSPARLASGSCSNDFGHLGRRGIDN